MNEEKNRNTCEYFTYIFFGVSLSAFFVFSALIISNEIFDGRRVDDICMKAVPNKTSGYLYCKMGGLKSACLIFHPDDSERFKACRESHRTFRDLFSSRFRYSIELDERDIQHD